MTDGDAGRSPFAQTGVGRFVSASTSRTGKSSLVDGPSWGRALTRIPSSDMPYPSLQPHMLRSSPMTPHRLAAIILLLTTQLSIQSRVARPETYAELVRKAQERSQAQDWPAAASLWQQVVEINPTVADRSEERRVGKEGR